MQGQYHGHQRNNQLFFRLYIFDVPAKGARRLRVLMRTICVMSEWPTTKDFEAA